MKRFWIEVTVTNEDLLLAAARRRAREENPTMSEQAIDALLQDEDDCIQMLFDPGVSPDGLEIEASGVTHIN